MLRGELEQEFQGLFDALTRKGRAKKDVIGTSTLDNAGKLPPARGGAKRKPKKCGCSKSEDEKCDCDPSDEGGEGYLPDDGEAVESTKVLVEIVKASDDEQTVTGVVLQPETTDAQGDIYSAAVIKEAAYNFLAGYNKTNKLGRQHADFKNWDKRFALVESYIAPMEFALNNRIIKSGSWLMTVKVLDSKVWKDVKDGKITGFSIGGKAKVKNLSNTDES